MRRAARENSSSFEATRQVERRGLGSAVGAMLNTMPDRGMATDTFMDYPPRQMPPHIDRSFSR
ncbi:hypothetical protein OESDEN_21584 [Oesophagostomum dentatum]|nr:hypothetical protein OESDEN_21584 [Oesophagostomum dentatum]